MADNLSSSQIKSWQKAISDSVQGKLIKSFTDVTTHINNLIAVTKTADSNNLNYRLTDLRSAVTSAKTQLTTCLTKFNGDMTTYLNKIVSLSSCVL